MQDVERAAGDIDPEIADRLGRRARKAADQRHRQHDAGRGRQEVLVRQAEHLREVGQRALAAVVLPVGVGDEADRRVERQIGRDRRLAGRIERQQVLETHQRVEDREAADMEQQHGDRVGHPMLLALLVDAARPIDRRLDRSQHRRQESALAVEHARHVAAEHRRDRHDDRAIEQNLNPADDSHGTEPLCVVRTALASAERKSGRS